MPRIIDAYAQEEEDYLVERFGSARAVLVTTRFAVHEPNDRPGRECHCCGHKLAWCIGGFDDLATIIDLEDHTRRNRWQLSAEGQRGFDELAGEAQPWGTPDADLWHAPIVYRVTEDSIAQICDDTPGTKYWSGGWRSKKTTTMGQWWSRGWVKLGGDGQILVLAAPGLKRAWKLMRKIFVGKAGNPAILPLHEGLPMLAASPLPVSHSVTDPSFAMLDGSIIELYHVGTGRGANLEGDDWVRAALDEGARVKDDGSAYEVMRGRVAEHGGAVGIASVPDDEGKWLYEKVVAEWEQRGERSKHVRVYTCATLDNIFLPKDELQAMADGTKDPKVYAEKIEGLWTRRGLYAYGDCWKIDEHQRDCDSTDPRAWGFPDDVTAQVARPIWGLRADEPVAWVGGADSNWDPQTTILGKVFGVRSDPSTWTLVLLVEQVLEGDSETAARTLAERDDGRFYGACIVPDGSMFHESHYHGPKKDCTNDAQQYRKHGFRVVPPMKAHGDEFNPGVKESRELNRIMMRANRILVSATGCPMLAHAITKVPNREKRKADSNTYLDRRVYNFDDSLRYLTWRLFSKRTLPRRPGLKIHGVSAGARAA